MLLIKDIPETQIVFFDIETDHQYAAYAELRMIGVAYGLNAEPELVETPGQRRRFKDAMRDPQMYKVAFNQINFDNLVLYRYGYPVYEENQHDLMLMMKTIAPGLPAYSLKFINYFYFGDMHLPEMELEGWAKRHRRSKWEAPKEILGPYCKHDITQTKNVFRLAWEVVQRPQHWRPYSELEMPMALPMEEMMLRGGEYLDADKIREELRKCEQERLGWNARATIATGGAVVNANSVKQVGGYLDLEGFELALTESGKWSLPKKELLDLRSKHPVCEAMFQVRRLNNTMAYYRNYLEALAHCPDHTARGWIPKQYGVSRARTRRILSDSKYGINFQNSNAAAKAVQIVPEGWLGVWNDATQIENIVHIHESCDVTRRRDYESKQDWSEYVWLCNKILGTKLTKEELDDIERFPSPTNPSWSVYKQYKTIKLALNFGMGADKYSKHTGQTLAAAKAGFDVVHRACPAIRGLQTKLITRFKRDGFVPDVFGHIYTANPRKAYKIVAYLIQGCGTGSLPKACIRALYDVVHECDVTLGEARRLGYRRFVADNQRGVASLGVLNGTTHDEIAARLSLDMGANNLLATLRAMRFVMTDMFSPLFDGIPLRTKTYLSRTTAKAAKQVDLDDPSTYEEYLRP